jgi:serine protease inhibitor
LLKIFSSKIVMLSVFMSIIVIVGVGLILINISGHIPSVKAESLANEVKPNAVKPVKLSQSFIQSTANFSFEIFKNSMNKDENTLISPTSIYLALGMTANGAADKTLKQFEAVLGGKKLSMDDLNSSYFTLSKQLQEIQTGKIKIANSIWYRDHKLLKVDPSFIQTNADYYGASVFKSDFNSIQTVTDINKWVETNTDGLIDKIVDEIKKDTMLYLINTVLFEAEWERIYRQNDIQESTFHLKNGSKANVEFMSSEERGYLKDDLAQGFVKPYKDSPYSFVAMLPNKDVNLEDYVQSLTGEKWLLLMKNRSDEIVDTRIPKFKYEYKTKLVDPLKKMGLKDGFDPKLANFNRMGNMNGEKFYIGDVLHKAYIQVDERGTKAGAVTAIGVAVTTSVEVKEQKSIILDQPFLYAIIDDTTNLPIFIGTVSNPK